MAGKLSLDAASRAYLRKLQSLISQSASFKALLESIRSSKKTYLAQKSRLEEKTLDDTFIIELETGFAAIEKIIANPRSFIKDNDVLVEAGRAKRISSRSISHLASHTQYVHSVDEQGNVTPEKLLVPESEVDYWIYENRFLMTLIQKAGVFVEKRFLFVRDHGETRDSEVLLLHSEETQAGVKFEVDTRIKVSAPSKDGGQAEKNEELLLRLARLRERVAFFNASPFMALMKGAKPVANPIHPTNLLVKNPDYKKCFALWKFLDAYKELGISYNVQEDDKKFDDAYIDNLAGLLAESILTLDANLIEKDEIKAKSKKKKIVPKVLFSLEDETFYDGKFLYDQFPLAEREQSKIPLAPTQEEAKAYREQFEAKLKADKAKLAAIEEAIEKQKAKDVEEEAKQRKEEAELQRKEDERRAEIRRLELERARLEAEKKKLEDIQAKEEEEIALLRQTRIEVHRLGLIDRNRDIESGYSPYLEESQSHPYPDATPSPVAGGAIISDNQGIAEIDEAEDELNIPVPERPVYLLPAPEKEGAFALTSPEEEGRLINELIKDKDEEAAKPEPSEAKAKPEEPVESVEESLQKAEEKPETKKKPAAKKKPSTKRKTAKKKPQKSDDSPKKPRKKPVKKSEEAKPIAPVKKKGKAARKAKKAAQKAEEAQQPKVIHYTNLKTRSKRGGRIFVKDYGKKRGKR